MVTASKAQSGLGALMVVAAVVYLVPFVPRGWIPHDEGMLGQSADRVLHGAIPHLDYEEPYTGGLSWVYAGLFKVTGVDLLHIRWLLFAGAAGAAWLMYAIFRRYLAPPAAALATWVCIGWSFPNYFAGLPSWWLLICALACMWAIIRYAETKQCRYVAVAGLAAGVAIAVKQTGVYLLVALVLSIFYGCGARRSDSGWLHVDRVAGWIAGAAALVFAGALLWPRRAGAESVYLFLPAAACAAVLLLPSRREWPGWSEHGALALVGVATATAALPLLCLMIPYLLHGRLWDLFDGAFLLPQKRLVFASAPMRGAWLLATGVPLVPLVFTPGWFDATVRSAAVRSLLWCAALGLPLLALWNVTSYQAIWQSSRAVAVLLPLAICWRLTSGTVREPEQRFVLFGAASVLTWMALNQFPFAAPVYFCYGAPLAVVAVVLAAGNAPSRRRDTLLPWAVMLLLFAVTSANRGYIESLGVNHDPRRFDTALRLPRAHLKVSADDARAYRWLMFRLDSHLEGAQLIAGPDCPQVYFLSGRMSPSGAMFDFFSNAAGGSGAEGMAEWEKADVIVLNHAPHFSPAPSQRVVAELRQRFPFGEQIGSFEVRWR